MAIYFVLFKFVFANETVSGPSMQPTFESNDRIIAVRHSKLQRGDIVILKAPDEPGALYIKRIIGVPGDTIESKNDTLYVNGKKVAEPYLTQYEKKLPKGQLYTNNFTLKKLFGVERVPKDSYFVMGDHRDVSKDSRMIGFIKKSAIVGEVKVRYYPFNQFRFF
ncbi:signal peptidase I [Lactobacillus hominis DSM 23910 = CRBIP 24.179]|nr:signal peptidase I [Lactobacillus hominis DSM 23910 = CRBIP 24.179]